MLTIISTPERKGVITMFWYVERMEESACSS